MIIPFLVGVNDIWVPEDVYGIQGLPAEAEVFKSLWTIDCRNDLQKQADREKSVMANRLD